LPVDGGMRKFQPMDAIEMLTEQHRHIEDLFDRLDVVDIEETRADLFRHLARALAMHGTVEREHFYPIFKKDKFKALADDSVERHDEADKRLAELLGMRPTGREFDRKLDELWDLVDAHFRKEESVLFPKMRELLDADALDALGDEIEATLDDLPDREPRELVAPDSVPPFP
jgi:hemerythrin superfamily protein